MKVQEHPIEGYVPFEGSSHESTLLILFLFVFVLGSFVAIYALAPSAILFKAWQCWAAFWMITLVVFVWRNRPRKRGPEPNDDYWRAVHRNLRT